MHGPAKPEAEPEAAPAQDPWPSPRYAWGMVVALLVAYILSFADRQILSLLVGPVKADLNLSDTQFSLLAGLAFAFFFTFMGLPLGRLADRATRKFLVAGGALASATAGMLATMSGSFGQLFGARALAGTADAALGPSAFSMLADLFPPEKRGKAFSVYSLGIYLGAGIAFGIGGLIVGALSASPTVVVPVFGEIRSWQAVFLIIALPSLVASPFFLLLPEPKRRGLAAPGERLSVKATASYVWQRRGLFLPYFVGFGIIVMANFATLAWTPEFFIRQFGTSPRDAGVMIGMMMAACGALGVLSGGWFTDWLQQKRGRRDAVLITGMVTCIGFMTFSVLFPLMPTEELARAALAPVFFFGAFASGAAPSAIGAVTPNEMRGQVSALYLLSINLLGIGLGPTVPALFTDFVFRDEALLGASLVTTAAITGIPAALLLNRARARYVREATHR
ncbi:MAG: MFS transporter [Thermaurantiacus sp.]